MKIIYSIELKSLAEKLGEYFGIKTQKIKIEKNQNDESVIFVGRGGSNKYLKGLKKYPKCWEIGSVADSFDYLRKVILNEETVTETKPEHRRRKSPEKVVAQAFDYDCGWGMVCTLMLMLDREDVLKTDLYQRLGVSPEEGTRSEKIKELFEEEKIGYLEIWNGSLGDIEKILDGGGVVMVSYQAWGEPEEIEKLECGHYSIVFDVDEEFVWLIDPSGDVEYTPGLGKAVVKRSREEFEKLWIDKGADGTVYEKWMMAVRM